MLIKSLFLLILCDLSVGVLGNTNGCSAPDHKPHSTFSPNKTFYDLDDVIIYTCENGYLRNSGSLQIKCIGYPALKVFTWTAEPANCSLIDCGPLTIENGVVQQTVSSTIYKAEYKYICDSGYYPMNSTAVCNAQSQWEYSACKREPKCAKPILSLNLSINSTKLEYSVGDAIAFSCSDGFLLSGSPVSRCTLNEDKAASWDGMRAGCVEGVKPTDTNATPNTTPSQSTLKSYAIPVAAGVTTAVILTTVLIFALCCIHKRKLRKQSQSSQGDTMSNSDVSSHTCVLSNQRNTLARTSTSSQSTNNDVRPPNSTVSPGFTSIHQLMDPARSSSPQSVSTYSEHNHPHQYSMSPIPLISPSTRNSSCSGSFRQTGKPQYCCSHLATLERQSSLSRQVSPYQHTCNALCAQCPPGHQTIPNNNNSNSNVGTPLGTPHRTPLSYEKAAHEKDYHFYQPLEHIYEDPNLYLRQQQIQQLHHQPGQFFV